MSVQVVPIPAGSSVAVVEDNDRRNRGDERSRHPDHYDLQTAITDSRNDISRIVDTECDEVSSGVGALGATVQDRFLAMQKQLSDTNTHTLMGFKDSMALAYQVEGRGALDAAKNLAAIQVQADKNSAALTVQADKNAAALAGQADKIAATTQLQAQMFASTSALEAEKNASASVLLAQQLASAAAAQAAECCCALKEKITLDGDKTRALINSIEQDRLRERATKAEQMLAAYYSAGKSPVVP